MNSVKNIAGYAASLLVAIIVLAFLGLHSLSFFEFTFPADQSFYAYLGFGLTSGGVVLYLVMLLTISQTPLKKFIVISMLCVSVVGEILTAMFGMRVEAWKASGFALSQEDLDMMVLAVGILGGLHGLALIGHFGGDAIYKAFQDEDGDGIPNAFDKDTYKPKQFKTFPSQTADNTAVLALEKRIRELESQIAKNENPTPGAGKQ